MNDERRRDRLGTLNDRLQERLDAAQSAPLYDHFRSKLYTLAQGRSDEAPTVDEFLAAVEDLRGRNERRQKVEAAVDAIIDSVVGPEPEPPQMREWAA